MRRFSLRSAAIGAAVLGPHAYTWAICTKRELEQWIRRFIRARLQLHADEIVVSGPPWRTTFCIRCHDRAKSPEGEVVYENRAVIWGRMSWGKVNEYEVYEDTQKTTDFDQYLAEHELAAA